MKTKKTEGLVRNQPTTPEGKFPIVLRRDGTALEHRFIVLTLRDPFTGNALLAYAEAAAAVGMPAGYVADIRRLAEAAQVASLRTPIDPVYHTERPDDPATLAWARSLGCPGS